MCESARAWIEFAATFLGFIGTVSAAYGTYLITQWYHPFSLRDFAASSITVFWYFVTCRRHKALESAMKSEELSPNSENKEVSLAGIYLVAVGFMLQTISALILLLVAILGIARQAFQFHN